MNPDLPEIDFQSVGPTIGDRFPDIRLPDQHGRIIDLHRERAGKKALVLFYRSASW